MALYKLARAAKPDFWEERNIEHVSVIDWNLLFKETSQALYKLARAAKPDLREEPGPKFLPLSLYTALLFVGYR